MATQTQQWIPLDEIITAYIDRSEQSPNKYMKLYNLAYAGMQSCGLDVFYQVKTIMLPVNANQTVNLPEDYLQYSKVGLLNSAGEVATIKRNDNISKLKPYNSNRADNNSLSLDVNSNDFMNYWQDGCCYNICGVTYNASGFTVDEKEGLLFLNNINTTAIVLEYLASPNPDEDYKVPVQFSEALIAFLGWQDIMYTPSKTHVNNANVGMRKNNFYNERRLAIARFKPFRLQDAYDTSICNVSFASMPSATVNTPSPIISVPSVSTVSITSIAVDGAVTGGTISGTGGAAITAKGVCYSTSPNPTITNAHTSDGTGANTFASTLTGLTNATVYYVRAYATNSAGTSYGNQLTFTTSASITITDDFMTQKTTLTSSQILALNATPINVVPAQGAGTYIRVIGVIAKVSGGTTAYGGDTTLRFSEGLFTQIMTAASALGALVGAINNYSVSTSFGTADYTTVANQPVQVYTTSAPTGGDTTFDLYITYTVVTL